MRRLTVALAVTLWAIDASGMVWPNTIERVETELSSPDVATRRSAARELHLLPRSAARRLLHTALRDADPEVRVAAAEAAIQVRFEQAAKIARAWLSDTDGRVRQVAAQLLGFFPLDAETLTNLGRALADPQAEVRLAAAQSLGASRSSLATLPLLGHLDDSNPEVEVAVVRALERLRDSRSIMPLVGKIQDTRSQVRRAVAMALGALGGARVVPGLVLALRDNDAKVRAAAVQALGKTGSEDAVDALSGVLSNDDDPAVQVAVLFALAAHDTSRTARLVIDALGSLRSSTAAAARGALLKFGPSAAPVLEACLRSPPSINRADGCVSGLATGAHPRAFELVAQAWAQRSVTPSVALEVMATLADRRALPIALEALGSEEPALRGRALQLADVLLSPDVPDGRAVEPIVAALDAAAERPEERIALVSLLGQTGTPRAAQHIAPFVSEHASTRLRVAALRALGQVGAGVYGDQLMAALSDESSWIRREAALAIRRSGGPGVAPALLNRLESAAEQDRLALALALSGALSGTESEPLLQRTRRLSAHASGAVQDALLEAIAQAAPRHARRALLKFASDSHAPIRAKVAEVLAGVDGSAAQIRKLLSDGDGRVRANAVWSLGVLGGRDELAALEPAFKDPEISVVANAVASFARIGARLEVPVGPQLCALLDHRRSYVRANALAGLRVNSSRCASGQERWLLSHDPSAIVRERAASLLLSVPSAEAGADGSALQLCLAAEPHGSVAAACAPDRSAPGRTLPENGRVGNVVVFVSSALREEPAPLSPYALQFADDLLRLGVSDRRGAVCTSGVPRGTVRLRVPEALAD